jgi:hypothetical protein
MTKGSAKTTGVLLAGLAAMAPPPEDAGTKLRREMMELTSLIAVEDDEDIKAACKSRKRAICTLLYPPTSPL